MRAVNCLLQLAYVIALFSCSHYLATASEESETRQASLDVRRPGPLVSSNFCGLSFEVAQLLPNDNGLHYFRKDNQPLINLFHSLGVKSLRVGGNTSDRDANKLPSAADWDSLFGFAKAAGVKVIYCLQLHKGDPQVAAQSVQYIMDHYGSLVDAFSIGQESTAYPVANLDDRSANARMGPAVEHYDYSIYAKEWKRFAAVITAVVPQVKFCGPGVHLDGRWACAFMADFGHSNHVALITEHLYPGGAAGAVPTPAIGRSLMLSDDFQQTYQKLYESFVPQTISSGLPYRLEEVNNFYNGGATDVSDTFAAALWGLDFMYWWAEHGAAGVNFHTGDRVAAGSSLTVCKYTALLSTSQGYHVRPLGYGIKAFDLGSHGQIIPVVISGPKRPDLSIYAVLSEDQTLYVTVLNKQSNPKARHTKLALRLNGGHYTTATAMSLVTHDNNVAAREGQTLGGAVINEDGSWHGTWTSLKSSNLGDLSRDILNMEIPPASGCIVRLTTARAAKLLNN